MASLAALPCELSLHITKFLDLGDKLHLSATCRSYRTQLIPEIFNTIYFNSDEASAASALAAAEAYGQYTKTIVFTCQCHHEDRPPLTGPSLPPAACKVLKGLLTPNLHTVKLEFDFKLDDEDLDPFEFFEDPEDADKVRREEGWYKWRALMNEAWEALLGNSLVREIILAKLPPKLTSTYYTDAFHRFLKQLESATIHILGMPRPDWRTNATFGFRDFVNKLGDTFFRHMYGLRHLHLQATDPLGCTSDELPYHQLPLRPEYFPVLQSLALENCFVVPELVLFIKHHARVLESLRLIESFCEEDLSWADFFDQVYEAKPSLSELIYRHNKASFLIDVKELEKHVIDDSAFLVLQRVCQRLEADPTLNLFRQGHLDADTGELFFKCDDDVKRFNQGDDQRAYVRLMALVNANRAGAKFDYK
jgi:hypothetical protein